MRYISVKYGCALYVRAFMNAYGSRSYNYSFYQWVGITATMEILTKNTYVTKLAFFMILRFMIITRFSKRPNSNARENQIYHYDALPASCSWRMVKKSTTTSGKNVAKNRLTVNRFNYVARNISNVLQ
ncbi:uncharacterized protein ACN427_005068 isoform 1-T1 [Glossina fuscipes fuscipes]